MKKILPYIVLAVFAGACGNDDYEMPQVEITEPEIDGPIVNVQAVKNQADFETGEIYTYSGTEAYMEAYVVSSDEAGNFYHELHVQNKATNPTAGIKILINQNSLFQTYNFGRKIYVKLDGLSVGVSNGVPVLGYRNNGNISDIPFPVIEEHILRSTEIADIEPLETTIDEFSLEYASMFVKVPNVQFLHNYVGENPITFAAEPIDEYDGERILESCESGATVVLTTSTYASFNSINLPEGSGSITGVLSRNFYDDFFILKLNSASDINFVGQRCDPEFLACEGENSGGPEIIFSEDFQGITNTASISTVLGWENINVGGTSGIFAYKNSFGNKFVTVSAFDTGEAPLSAWLITPEIDLENSTNEEFSFNVRASYANGIILKVYVTENYTGNPLTTEWTQLNTNIPMGNSGATDYFSVSKIDVSCLEGTVRFGFRYHGADPDRTTTYDIDNVRVTGEL